jgi:hypothetical protein
MEIIESNEPNIVSLENKFSIQTHININGENQI